MKTRSIRTLGLCLALSLACTACGSDGDESEGLSTGETDTGETDTGETDTGETDTGETDMGPEVMGVWENNFGGNEHISANSWNDSYSERVIVQFDNDQNLLITQNPDDDAFSPAGFNRVVWTELAQGSIHYCGEAFGLDSLEAALAFPEVAADTDDLETGCGGFGWTRLDQIAVLGSYGTQFESEETIDRGSWAGAILVSFENAERTATTRYPDDDEFTPGVFNRIVWTEPVEGLFHYCIEVFGQPSLDELEKSLDQADPADLQSGCGGFSWTEMSPL